VGEPQVPTVTSSWLEAENKLSNSALQLCLMKYDFTSHKLVLTRKFSKSTVQDQ
jgi:hypothetical protein